MQGWGHRSRRVSRSRNDPGPGWSPQGRPDRWEHGSGVGSPSEPTRVPVAVHSGVHSTGGGRVTSPGPFPTTRTWCERRGGTPYGPATGGTRDGPNPEVPVLQFRRCEPLSRPGRTSPVRTGRTSAFVPSRVAGEGRDGTCGRSLASSGDGKGVGGGDRRDLGVTGDGPDRPHYPVVRWSGLGRSGLGRSGLGWARECRRGTRSRTNRGDSDTPLPCVLVTVRPTRPVLG